MVCVPEIGVALTTFGGLFMLLGVMLFFDGALLALGNVRLHKLFFFHCRVSNPTNLSPSLLYTQLLDPLYFGFDVDHRPSEDVLLLCQKTKDSRDSMFLWWNSPRLYQVAIHWNDRGDVWVFESFWVRGFEFFPRFSQLFMFTTWLFPLQ